MKTEVEFLRGELEHFRMLAARLAGALEAHQNIYGKTNTSQEVLTEWREATKRPVVRSEDILRGMGIEP